VHIVGDTPEKVGTGLHTHTSSQLRGTGETRKPCSNNRIREIRIASRDRSCQADENGMKADPKGTGILEMYFVLDEQGEPLPVSDFEEWVQWCDRADRGVARTVVAADVVVLTTFNGVDEVVDGQTPLLFETRVFGGVLDGEAVQHSTRADALAAHAKLVEWCRMGNSPGTGLTDDQIT
jgi:hypothetical protein